MTRGCLRAGDQEIELPPKPFEVLRHLAVNAGRLVSKQELLEAVWADVSVSDDSLVQCIRELRQKLGDVEHKLIKTVSRRGYMLDAVVATPAPHCLSAELASNRPDGPVRIAVKPGSLLAGIRAQRVGMWGAAAAAFVCVALGQRQAPPTAGNLLRRIMRGTPSRTLAAIAAVVVCLGAGGTYLLVGSTLLTSSRGTAGDPAGTPPHPTFKDCAECPEMVALPAGEFLMGSPESEGARAGHEGPQRRVVVAERFAIGKFEVTIEQFAAFVADTGFEVADLCRAYIPDARPSQWPLVKGSFQEPGFRVTGKHPAVCVSWHDAKKYAIWLSRKTAKPYRLPTEGEWEYAARASTTTAYSFGDDLSKLCGFARFADSDSRFPWRGGCHSGVFEPGAVPVGTLAPNSWGLFDTYGNAWEWAEDCWTTDARLLPTDASTYKGVEPCGSRAVRGGGWGAESRRTRSAFRMEQPGDARYYHVGFRVVVSLGSP